MQDFFNSKFYEILCFVYKMIVLNIIFILSIIPIFTLFPAIISLNKVCKRYVHEKSNEIYSIYLRYYFMDFFRNSLVTLIFLGGNSILAYSIYGFYSLLDFNSLNMIGVVMASIFTLLFNLGFLHFPMIKTYFTKLGFWDEIKLSALFLIKFKKRSLLIVILLILNGVVFYFFPILIFIIGFSPLAYIIVRNLNNLYTLLVEKYHLE